MFITFYNLSNEVRHDGIVQSIEGDIVKVSIISKAACISCQMNSSCSTSDLSEKIIEINRYDVNFNIGESVTVALAETSGLKALFIGYMLPFFILLASLIITMHFTQNELISGLVSLAILVPYYFTLFVLNDFLKRQFSFFIHKR